MSFVRNTTGVLTTSVASVALGLVTSIVLARWLSVEDRGLYSVATNFAGILALLLSLGWPAVSVYRLRRIGSPPSQVAAAALIVSLAVSLGALLLSLVLAPEISHRFLDHAPLVVVYLAFAVVPFDVAANNFTSIARGIDRFALQNLYRIAVTLAVLVSTTGVLILGGGELSSALSAFVASHALVTLVFLARMLGLTGITFRVPVAEIRDGARFGLKSYVQSLAGNLHERVDILLLAFLLDDPAQVGLYAIAVSVVQRLKIIPESLANVLLPKLASQSHRDAAAFTRQVSRHSFGWVVLMAIGLAVAAPLAIPWLFGSAYRASTPAFLILLPGMVSYSIYRVVARFFIATDRQQANIATELTSLAANLGLNFWLIPKLGIAGAALASLISYSIAAVLVLFSFWMATGIGFQSMLVPTSADLEPYRKRLRALQKQWMRSG